MKRKIKVLIVDDSAIARDLMQNGLSQYSDIDIVGKAGNAYTARDKIVMYKPDVITLNGEMPKMNGVDFLKKLMPQFPLPVIMVSSFSERGSKITLEALDYGAVDFVVKPFSTNKNGISQMISELREKIKIAYNVDLSHWKKTEKELIKRNISSINGTQNDLYRLIAIGASTGGTVALRKIIRELPMGMPPIVIVQHMPPVFTKMFAESLNEISQLNVKEAVDNEELLPNNIYIAQGGLHLTVKKQNAKYYISLLNGEKVSGHCPSVDVLFESVAEVFSYQAIGLLLTGMGKDGAHGMVKLNNNKAATFAQNEQSSVVFGMPNEAYKLGAVDRMVHLDDISKIILKQLEQNSNAYAENLQ